MPAIWAFAPMAVSPPADAGAPHAASRKLMTTFALRRSLAGSRIRAAAAGCAVLESDVELISVAGAVVAAFSARGASEA